MNQGGNFLAALRQLESDCEQVQGTVLATGDGLVLAATGCLGSDTAAASAAYLAESVEQNLSLVQQTRCTELLVWSPSAVWYLVQMADQNVLMACAMPDCQAGALRLAASEAARQLSVLGSVSIDD